MKFWFLEVCLVTTFLSIFSLFLLVIVCVAQRKPTIAHTLTISNSRRKVDQRGEPVARRKQQSLHCCLPHCLQTQKDYDSTHLIMHSSHNIKQHKTSSMCKMSIFEIVTQHSIIPIIVINNCIATKKNQMIIRRDRPFNDL